MNKQTAWLLTEIDSWASEGILSPEQADRLRSRYAPPAGTPAVPWGLLVFATTGAIIIGLGVILLIAHNWADIPKAGKLALIFGAMLAAHGGGIRLLGSGGWQPRLGEALTVLGTMFYGAGIWLVAQIYNIDEHFPTGFLLWALGALAMAWAIRSVANGLMAIVLLVIWGCCESLEFRQPESWSMLLIATCLLPLAWRQRSILLLAASLASLQLLLAINTGIWGSGSLALTASLAYGVLLVAVARLLAATHREDFGANGILAFFGFGAFLICAYTLSFHDAARHLLDWRQHEGSRETTALVLGWTLFAAGLTGWGMLVRSALTRDATIVPREEWLLPIALVYCFGIAALGVNGFEDFVSWTFTLMLLGFAAMWIWRGCRDSLLETTVLGSLLLGVVVLARYFDLFTSLASRGLAFIILGAIFMAEALFYRRMRQGKGGAA